MNDGPGGERVRGWSNIPLSMEGKLDVAKTGELLAKLPVKSIVHSDLHRTTQTAQIIKQFCRSAVLVPSPACRTWDTGSIEGKLVADVLPILKFYFEHPSSKPAGGEAYAHFYKRWHTKLHQLLKYLRSHPGEVAVVVAHSYNICALEHAIRGGGTKIDNKCSVPPGSPVIVELPEDGSYKLVIPVKSIKVEVKA
jgi:broad specificity phosphatase PhoE